MFFRDGKPVPYGRNDLYSCIVGDGFSLWKFGAGSA